MRHYWQKSFVFTIIYSILFSILLIVTIMHVASERQIEDTQSAIGNAVLVRKVRKDTPNERVSLSLFTQDEVDCLVNDERVDSYNLITKNFGNIIDATPYVKDENKYKDLLEKAPYMKTELDNAQFIGVTDSQYSLFFSGVGFRLVKGRGITKSDETKNVILVSRELADLNTWDVGEEVELDIAKKNGRSRRKNFKAKIIGIYECPKDIYINESIEYTPDCMPENYIFIPQTTIFNIDSVEYQTNRVYVYMKSSEMIEKYIEDMQDELGVVIDDITQKGGKAEFRYSWDESWNQIISAPYQDINNLTRLMLGILLIATLVIVILVTSTELRGKRRELGIWMACGEKKNKILIHELIVNMLPIIAAVIIAVGVSLFSMDSISKSVLGDSTSRMNEQIQSNRQEVCFWENVYILDVEMKYANNNYFYVCNTLDLYRSRRKITEIALAGIASLAIIIVIQIKRELKEEPGSLLTDNR